MKVIDYLRDRGFSAKVVGNRLIVWPSIRLTQEERRYIKLHRLELMVEVAANDGEARRSHWTVSVTGYGPFTMIGEPMTHAEALVEARTRWPNAKIE
ncbi:MULTISPECIES: hypothetical protein [Pseudomonas]|jgi:hypothetical protein|uniref:Uncharacterized protein n=2 Tax=Pseudomonas TaxID=286 RepID=A0AAD0ZE75_9PSED|nr:MULTISPECIES: hypothetical protein [Pseudomonas]AZE30311.1 hypothetical protein C4K07_3526 [Pseudomonas chlororaphis subsp. aureofaciens]MBV4463595.1 hypothetical protein [Pseudomonas farris]UVK96431.1 hypothetical protein LOY56_13450 [Pseudomonas sp. B21-048]